MHMAVHSRITDCVDLPLARLPHQPDGTAARPAPEWDGAAVAAPWACRARRAELPPPRISRRSSGLDVGLDVIDGGLVVHIVAVGGVDGLLLQVTKTGATSWILRTMIAGKRRGMGLGSYPAVGVAAAREKARAARQQIEEGLDPIERRQRVRREAVANRESTKTFDQCARSMLEAKGLGWKNDKHRAQWSATLQTYASPILGSMPVNEIEMAHVLRVLSPIWALKTETASRVRGRIEKVLDYASAHKYRQGLNPARWKGNLDAVLDKPGDVAKVKHHAALPIDVVPDFMVRLREAVGMGARALELTILTAARSGEIRGAKWEEFDLESGTWVVPAERMKAKKEHRVPLSRQALTLLKAMPREDSVSLVFPAPRGGVLSDMTLTSVLRRMNVECTVHGFRSTFRDWAGDRTHHPRDMIEFALAHTLDDKTEAAYRRSDALEKRRVLMQEWADFVSFLLQNTENLREIV